MEKLIRPEDYTPEMLDCIQRIKYRMESTCVEFDDQDIRVFEYNETFYILANPILGNEPVFDELGNFVEMVPLRNITMMIPNSNRIETGWIKDKWTINVEMPKLRIMRPDLCTKITKDGKIIEGA